MGTLRGSVRKDRQCVHLPDLSNTLNANATAVLDRVDMHGIDNLALHFGHDREMDALQSATNHRPYMA